jgi:glycosyltransferase involved in cell wall biosynthesis
VQKYDFLFEVQNKMCNFALMNDRNYSIIVVTYNNAGGLTRTLNSICQLDYADKEVVVVDGGSSDGTPGIIAEYKDMIASSVSERDNGIYNAMNKGIKLAKGDYVVFMNAGDEFADKDVLTQVSRYAGDIILGEDIYGGQRRRLKDRVTLYDLLSVGIFHQAVYYRREVLQKYGFDESYKIIADLKSVVEPFVKDGITITCVTEPLAICESGGLSKQRWRDALTENRRLIDDVVVPFYRDDYQKLARINNIMVDDFIVLSYFPKLFPLIRLMAKIARFLNDKFKHIPIG